MKRMTQLFSLTALTAAAAFATAQPAGYTGPSSAKPAQANAQGSYTGPTNAVPMTAKDLLAKGKDEQAVKLQGKLLRYMGDDEYEFADQSGKMIVEIEANRFPAGASVDHNTVVELVGEFDKEMLGDSKVEVEQMRIVSR